MIFSKGDHIKQKKEIKGFNHVDKEFIITRIDFINRTIAIRFDGKVSEMFPEVNFLTDANFTNPLVFNLSIDLFDNFNYFHKVHTWTDWRKLPQLDYWDELIKGYTFDEKYPPMYRTNRKYVVFKANQIQARASCNEQDIFDLNYGLDLAIKRWKEKDLAIKRWKEKVNGKQKSTKSYVDFVEKKCDLIEMPCYYHIAHCISKDYNLVGYTASLLNKLCNLKLCYDEALEYENYFVGEVFYNKNIFSLITNEPYKKMSYGDLNECVLNMAEICLDNKVQYLAIPHFGCRKGNLKWEEVKEMVCTVFRSVYDDDNKNLDKVTINIVACDNEISIEALNKISSKDTVTNSVINSVDLNTTTNTTDSYNFYDDSIKNYKTKDDNFSKYDWIYRKKSF